MFQCLPRDARCGEAPPGVRRILLTASGGPFLDTPRTRLKLVRSRPIPFPPEPARWAVIQATRLALARADRNGGRRGPWLRLLDRLGLGFDS